MSIADKLNYLITTKALLKDNINKINNVLTDQSTFRSYPQELFNGYLDILNNGTDTLWNNLEKVSQTGTEAVLEGVETAPMKMVLNGNTSQETTTGKNLIDDYDLINRYNVASVSGNIITSNAINSNYNVIQPRTKTQTINLIENTDYYVSFDCRLKSGSYSAKLGTGIIDGVNGTSWSSGNTAISNPNMTGSYQRYSFKCIATITTNSIIGLTIQVQQNLSDAVFEIKNIMISTSSDDTYEPYTGSQPSPSPDYPQEVKVVKGENVVSVSGKNLVDKDNVVASPTIAVETVETGLKATLLTAGVYKYASIKLGGSELLGKQLMVRALMTPSSANNGGVYIYYGNANNPAINTANFNIQGSGYKEVTKALVDEFPNNCDGVYLLIYANLNGTGNAGDYVEYTNLQVEYGSQVTPYVPYSKTDYPINLVSKNLLTGTFRQGNSSGDPINRRIFADDNYYVEKGKTYILSTNLDVSQFNYALNISWNNFPTSVIFDSKWLTINQYIFTAEMSGHIGIPVRKADDSALTPTDIQDVWFKLEETIYGEETSLELCKINTYKDFPFKAINGNEYYDTLTAEQKNALNYGSWYVHKAIKKVVLDGSENYSTNSSWNYTNTNNYITALNSKGTISELRTNYFKYVSNTFALDTNGIASRVWNTHIIFRINKTIAPTIEDFKTWLSTHNTIVYYVPATPTEEEITNTTLIEQLEAISKAKSVKYKTYITQTNDDLPFILDVEAIKEYEVN